ncbi:MAG: triose-phosphate isomerase [Bacteroidetes bacterium]|nr:MAG: triose-phosphate isomerase [Bacteroidota bacterium]
MRKNIVAGNWKMNATFQEAEELIADIVESLEKNTPGCEVIVCPPAVYLELASDYANDYENVLSIGAQNVSEYEKGAYTGEIAASMLASMSMEYCIVGHSERRKYFGETNQQLALKVERLLENAIHPIFCCGEQLEEREAGNHFKVVETQIKEALFHFSNDEFSNLLIAYEPVWAIGTGKTATTDQAQEMHAYIRTLIAEKFGKETAEDTTILYGGSCNAANAKELFANKDVDGGLIGGASLKANDFVAIANSF